jgi:hypothetical protein
MPTESRHDPRRLPLLVALIALAGCAATPDYTARPGELIVTVDNGGAAIPPGATPPAAADSLTELRWLGLYGAQALFLQTEQTLDALTVPETQEQRRIRPRESTNIVLDTTQSKALEVRGWRVLIEDITPERIGFALKGPS